MALRRRSAMAGSAGFHQFVNISQMITYNVPIGSDVRMTKLRDKKVLMRSAGPTKLGVRMERLSTIERVHVNGNLTTLLCKGITERSNIRRDLPYC